MSLRLSVMFVTLLGLAFLPAQSAQVAARAQSGPVGGTADETLRMLLSNPMPTMILPVNIQDVCNAVVTMRVLDAVNPGAPPLAELNKVAVPVGGSLQLNYSFDPGQALRQEVLTVLIVERTPDRDASAATLGSLCRISASVQVFDETTGRTGLYEESYDEDGNRTWQK